MLFAIFVFLVDEMIKLAKAKSNAIGFPPIMLWTMIASNSLSFIVFGFMPLVDGSNQILYTSVKGVLPSIVSRPCPFKQLVTILIPLFS